MCYKEIVTSTVSFNLNFSVLLLQYAQHSTFLVKRCWPSLAAKNCGYSLTRHWWCRYLLIHRKLMFRAVLSVLLMLVRHKVCDDCHAFWKQIRSISVFPLAWKWSIDRQNLWKTQLEMHLLMMRSKSSRIILEFRYRRVLTMSYLLTHCDISYSCMWYEFLSLILQLVLGMSFLKVVQ